MKSASLSKPGTVIPGLQIVTIGYLYMLDKLRYTMTIGGAAPYVPLRQATVDVINGSARLRVSPGDTATQFTVEIAPAVLNQVDELTRIDAELTGIGYRVTRCDVYADVCHPLPNVGDEARALYRGRGGQPQTMYFGSRQSAVMLRVYDKRAEVRRRLRVDLGQELTRYEFEFKRRRANDVFRFVLFHWRAGVAPAEIVSAVMARFDVWGVCPDLAESNLEVDLSKAAPIRVDVTSYYKRHRKTFLHELENGELGQLMAGDIKAALEKRRQ